ncbi:hypothetical protein [Desulfuromonas acetoxidans]|uniref:hypothetical protein n=1 Tax=Desulfuromonas acetoxidans TaxID=891 RepID=UPI00292EBDC2|nr:hypothetical protein [Desulfuromonas acetoxidans]
MALIPEIFEAINPIRGWLAYFQNRRDTLRAEEKSALRALYVAANETRLYFRRLNHENRMAAHRQTPPPERNISKEEELSRLWLEASIEMRNFNMELAERCFVKGGYWADPDAWSDRDIVRANISLDNIFREARELLSS